MLGYDHCQVNSSWPGNHTHHGGLNGSRHLGVSISVWIVAFLAVVSSDEAAGKNLGCGGLSSVFPVPAAALHRKTAQMSWKTGSQRPVTEGAGVTFESEVSPPFLMPENGSDHSLGYWAAEASFSGVNRVEWYAIVESTQENAVPSTPSQLQAVAQLIRLTRREKIVEDENRFRDKRFESFTAGLRNFAQANFRPFTSSRSEKLHYRPASPQYSGNYAPFHSDSSGVGQDQLGEEYQVGRVQLLEAIPGRIASRISVLVEGPKSQWSAADDTSTCLGRRCGRAPKEVAGVTLSFAKSLRQVPRKARRFHGLIQGFLSEVIGSVSDAELETELRWELRIWKYLPAWRALELAEKEHILIPMHLLRHERQASAFEEWEKPTGTQRSHTTLDTESRVEAGSSLDSSHLHDNNSASRKTLGAVDKEVQEDRWSDRVSEKVYNVFIYFPKGYRDTVGSLLIPSEQITETWFHTATTDFLVTVTTQMILAVANLNSYGLVHTHIRPSSFVVDLEGFVLLSDLHRAVPAGETMDCLSDRVRGINDLTASPEESACMYQYASNYKEHEDRKEHIVGPMQAEFPVDSWRLGVILYRLWCREPAHDRRSHHEFHLRHLRARAAGEYVAVDAYLEVNRLPMKYCRKDMQSSLQRLVRQMLVAEPASRITAAEAVNNSSLFHNLRRTKEEAPTHERGDTRQK